MKSQPCSRIPVMGRRRQTHCQRGHEFTPENSITGSNGHRRCRICWNARRAAYRATEHGRATERKYRQSDRAKAYAAEYARSERGRAMYNAHNRRRHSDRLARIAAIKVERACIDCGYNAHSAALQFDHRSGLDKVRDISRMLTNSWELIEAEIAKCDVRCANCHAIKTVERRREAASAIPA